MLNNERAENLERSAPLCRLQIDSQLEGVPLQFPVTVLDFADGLVILEIKNPLEAINPKTLSGAGASLRWETAANSEAENVKGTVIWSRASGEGKSGMVLGLKLEDQEATAEKFLEALMPHAAPDLRSLWKRWDDARIKPVTVSRRAKIYSALLGLAVPVIALKLMEPKSFHLAPYLLLLSCGLFGAYKIIGYLHKKRASHKLPDSDFFHI